MGCEVISELSLTRAHEKPCMFITTDLFFQSTLVRCNKPVKQSRLLGNISALHFYCAASQKQISTARVYRTHVCVKASFIVCTNWAECVGERNESRRSLQGFPGVAGTRAPDSRGLLTNTRVC